MTTSGLPPTALPTTLGSEVRLEVPASEEFVRPIRLVTGEAGARAGFGVDAVDDIRLAVTELCSALVASGANTMHVRIATTPGRIAVAGRVDMPARAVPDLDAIASIVVDVVSDRYTLESSENAAWFTFEKRAAHSRG